MTFNLSKYENHLLFLPLGGSNEIGMNFNLYYYQGKWLIIDMGAGFADDHYPGIDLIVPSVAFIKKYKNDIVGIVLTHAHEDHLGGVEHLWRELECEIYTTTFTANFLRSKLLETDFYNEIKIHEIKPGGKINLEPFNLEFIPLTHSAPEMQAILIRTELGNILHTGDWKFDHDPLIGEANDEKLLAQYGKNGILAMIADSTNVFKEEYSGSEGDLRKSLIELIAACANRVAVTTFASNLARVETLAQAGIACGRKIFVAGKSLWRVIEAAKQSGYLKGIEFLKDSEINKYNKEDILIICTGCQGEPFAAMTKIATDTHPTLKLSKGDSVIFSSKIIPGNEKKIFRIFNILIKSGIEVLTERDHFVHVSGHPSRKELERMYELIKPQIAIPVHGEAVHIHEHSKLAKQFGVPQTVEVENGSLISLAPGPATLVSKIPAEYYVVDGNYLILHNSNIMKARRRMRDNGIVIISLFLSRTNILKAEPLVIAPGLLDSQDDKEILQDIKSMVLKNIEASYRNINIKTNNSKIIEIAKQTVKKFIKNELGKDPAIEVCITHC
jgi:ribonuclease J